MASSHTAVVVLLVASSFVVALSSGEVHGGVEFSYSGSTGPENWGNLCPEYKLCKDGKQQSPINIVTKDAVPNRKLDHVERSYAATNATLINIGTSISLKFEGEVGTAFVNGKNYSLNNMHWHSPSEHTIDGERFPLELHLVHKSNDGDYTVVAILYKYGRPDSFYIQLKDKLTEMADEKCGDHEDSHIPVGVVQMISLTKRTGDFFRYSGSFSTPPCSENVIWNILGKIREISKEQVDLLLSPLSGKNKINARPTQPLNGRIVQVYDVPQN